MATRTLTDTPTVTWDEATAGQLKGNVPDEAITNAKLADMAAATIKGRALAAGAGEPTDLAAADVAAILGFGVGTGSGFIDLTEIAAPASPSSNVARLYAVDSGGTTKVEAKDSAGNTHDLTHFTQSGAGAVLRTQQARLRDVIHVKDFGAVGDGVTNDDAALNAAKTAADASRNAIVSLSGGRYLGGRNFTTGTPIWTNHVQPTVMRFDKPSVLGLFEGINSDPDVINDDPVLWVQKYTKFDNAADNNAQNVGGVFAEVIVKGSGSTGTTETDAVWTAILGNAVSEGTNQGSAGSPDFDWDGSVIGVAGFARAEKPPQSAGIITGLWGYATSPSVTDTEFDNTPNAFSSVGLEINIENRHKDPGALSDFGLKGTTAGVLLGNFPSAIGKRDWSFGIVFYPLPQDGNFSSTDPANWGGYHDGMFVDCYKRAGIRLGRGQSGASGILFPSSYTHANFRPTAGISMGDNQINMGSFTGTPANGDFYRNSSGDFLFRDDGGDQFSIGSVATAINRLEARGAATGGLPAMLAIGSDTDISVSWRAKGNARHDFSTGNGVQLTILNGGGDWLSIQAGTGAPVIGVVSSNADADIAMTPKGTGIVRSAAAIKSSSATAGIGYATGAGGAVTQATNKTTGVTLNKICGQITLAAGTINAGAEATFAVTNSAVATTDCIIVNHDSVGTSGAYGVFAHNIGAGSFSITVTNLSAGNLDEQIVLNFAVIKAVAA